MPPTATSRRGRLVVAAGSFCERDGAFHVRTSVGCFRCR
jgi:hypothetical protein